MKLEILSKKDCSAQEPLVSICCITYNHEKFIAQALDGFLMQKTDFPFEILVHDDASTDNTANIIREYERRYPNLVKPIYQTDNQYSQGKDVFAVVSSRAKGKYIACCEGDDYWTDSNKLQTQVDFLEAHPEYSMCFHAAEIKKEDNLFSHAECDKVADRDYSAIELLKNWVAPSASFVYRRTILDYPIKNPQNFVMGDIVSVLKSCAMGKVRGFSKKMSIYRIHQNSVSYTTNRSKESIMRLPEHFECIKDNFPFVSSMYLNQCLAYWYWKRAAIQPTLSLSFLDRVKALRLSPFAPLAILTISTLSKVIGEQRIWEIFHKVAKKI